jgi:hypothetical protein
VINILKSYFNSSFDPGNGSITSHSHHEKGPASNFEETQYTQVYYVHVSLTHIVAMINLLSNDYSIESKEHDSEYH